MLTRWALPHQEKFLGQQTVFACGLQIYALKLLRAVSYSAEPFSSCFHSFLSLMMLGHWLIGWQTFPFWQLFELPDNLFRVLAAVVVAVVVVVVVVVDVVLMFLGHTINLTLLKTQAHSMFQPQFDPTDVHMKATDSNKNEKLVHYEWHPLCAADHLGFFVADFPLQHFQCSRVLLWPSRQLFPSPSLNLETHFSFHISFFG